MGCDEKGERVMEGGKCMRKKEDGREGICERYCCTYVSKTNGA
jgi:hypothetical protein